MSGLGAFGLAALEAGKDIGVAAFSNRAIQRREMENFYEQSAYNNARQDFLNRSSALTQVHALRNAGLNPALAFGDSTFNASVNSGSGSTSATNMPDINILEALTGYANVENLKEQNKVLRQDAEAKRLDNEDKQIELDRKRSEDDRYAKTGFFYRQFDISAQEIADYLKADGVFVDDAQFDWITFKNKGDFDAFMSLDQGKADVSQHSADILENKFKQLVNEKKFADKDLAKLLVNGEKDQYRALHQAYLKAIAEADKASTESKISKIDLAIREFEKIIKEKEKDNYLKSSAFDWFEDIMQKGDIGAEDLFRLILIALYNSGSH